MFRLRPTSVTGFPRCGSIAACHAVRPIPPSSNRTCGFPASGSPENSRRGHLQGVVRLNRSQRHPSQFTQMLVKRLPFWTLEGSLAPPFKVSVQPPFDKGIETSEGFARIAIVKVVFPPTEMPVHILQHSGNGKTSFVPGSGLTYLIPYPCLGLLRRRHVQIPTMPVFIQTAIIAKRETKKVQTGPSLPQVDYAGLFPADFQPHPALNLRFDPLPKAFPLVARKDDKVVRITHQTGILPIIE